MPIPLRVVARVISPVLVLGPALLVTQLPRAVAASEAGATLPGPSSSVPAESTPHHGTDSVGPGSMPESQSGSTPSAQQEVVAISPSPSASPQPRTAAHDHGRSTVPPTAGDDGGMDGMDGMTGMDGMGDMPGMEHSHAPATEASVSRPRGLVLGGFGLVNGLVLAVAATLRRSGRGERERRRARRAMVLG